MVFKKWLRSGTPWIWLNAAAVSASVVLVAGLLLLIGSRGLANFWPLSVQKISYQQADGRLMTLAGQVRETEKVSAAHLREAGISVEGDRLFMQRVLLKTANRDITGQDFRWILNASVISSSQPYNMVVMERQEWGDFIGLLLGVRQDGQLQYNSDTWSVFQQRLARVNRLRNKISALEKNDIGAVNYALEQLRLKQRGLELEGGNSEERLAEIEHERAGLKKSYADLEGELEHLNEEIGRDAVVVQYR